MTYPFVIAPRMAGKNTMIELARKLEREGRPVRYAVKGGRLVFLTPAERRTMDAPDEWIIAFGIGGFVCSACGTPVESEPCAEHQPAAYAAIT